MKQNNADLTFEGSRQLEENLLRLACSVKGRYTYKELYELANRRGLIVKEKTDETEFLQTLEIALPNKTSAEQAMELDGENVWETELPARHFIHPEIQALLFLETLPVSREDIHETYLPLIRANRQEKPETMFQSIVYGAFMRGCDGPEIELALQQTRQRLRALYAMQKAGSKSSQTHLEAVSILDDRYPSQLHAMKNAAPLILYCQGNEKLLQGLSVGASLRQRNGMNSERTANALSAGGFFETPQKVGFDHFVFPYRTQSDAALIRAARHSAAPSMVVSEMPIMKSADQSEMQAVLQSQGLLISESLDGFAQNQSPEEAGRRCDFLLCALSDALMIPHYTESAADPRNNHALTEVDGYLVRMAQTMRRNVFLSTDEESFHPYSSSSLDLPDGRGSPIDISAENAPKRIEKNFPSVRVLQTGSQGFSLSEKQWQTVLHAARTRRKGIDIHSEHPKAVAFLEGMKESYVLSCLAAEYNSSLDSRDRQLHGISAQELHRLQTQMHAGSSVEKTLEAIAGSDPSIAQSEQFQQFLAFVQTQNLSEKRREFDENLENGWLGISGCDRMFYNRTLPSVMSVNPGYLSLNELRDNRILLSDLPHLNAVLVYESRRKGRRLIERVTSVPVYKKAEEGADSYGPLVCEDDYTSLWMLKRYMKENEKKEAGRKLFLNRDCPGFYSGHPSMMPSSMANTVKLRRAQGGVGQVAVEFFQENGIPYSFLFKSGNEIALRGDAPGGFVDVQVFAPDHSGKFIGRMTTIEPFASKTTFNVQSKALFNDLIHHYQLPSPDLMRLVLASKTLPPQRMKEYRKPAARIAANTPQVKYGNFAGRQASANRSASAPKIFNTQNQTVAPLCRFSPKQFNEADLSSFAGMTGQDEWEQLLDIQQGQPVWGRMDAPAALDPQHSVMLHTEATKPVGRRIESAVQAAEEIEKALEQAQDNFMDVLDLDEIQQALSTPDLPSSYHPSWSSDERISTIQKSLWAALKDPQHPPFSMAFDEDVQKKETENESVELRFEEGADPVQAIEQARQLIRQSLPSLFGQFSAAKLDAPEGPGWVNIDWMIDYMVSRQSPDANKGYLKARFSRISMEEKYDVSSMVAGESYKAQGVRNDLVRFDTKSAFNLIALPSAAKLETMESVKEVDDWVRTEGARVANAGRNPFSGLDEWQSRIQPPETGGLPDFLKNRSIDAIRECARIRDALHAALINNNIEFNPIGDPQQRTRKNGLWMDANGIVRWTGQVPITAEEGTGKARMAYTREHLLQVRRFMATGEIGQFWLSGTQKNICPSPVASEKGKPYVLFYRLPMKTPHPFGSRNWDDNMLVMDHTDAICSLLDPIIKNQMAEYTWEVMNNQQQRFGSHVDEMRSHPDFVARYLNQTIGFAGSPTSLNFAYRNGQIMFKEKMHESETMASRDKEIRNLRMSQTAYFLPSQMLDIFQLHDIGQKKADALNDLQMHNGRYFHDSSPSRMDPRDSALLESDVMVPGASMGKQRQFYQGLRYDSLQQSMKPAGKVQSLLDRMPEYRNRRFDSKDRTGMSVNNEKHMLQRMEKVHVAYGTAGGFNMEDGIIISRELAEKHRVPARGSDQLRPLSIQDKLCDYHGNKGVVSLVVDRSWSESEARSRGEAVYRIWSFFRENPMLDMFCQGNAFLSRRNAGLIRDGIENHSDLIVEGKTIPGGMIEIDYQITDKLADTKVSIYDEDAQSGRKISPEIINVLQAQGCTELLTHFFGKKMQGLKTSREYMIAAGFDVDEDLKLHTGYRSHDQESRFICPLLEKEDHLLREGALKGVAVEGLKTRPTPDDKVMEQYYRQSFGQAGGFLSIPFELQLSSGNPTPPLMKDEKGKIRPVETDEEWAAFGFVKKNGIWSRDLKEMMASSAIDKEHLYAQFALPIMPPACRDDRTENQTKVFGDISKFYLTILSKANEFYWKQQDYRKNRDSIRLDPAGSSFQKRKAADQKEIANDQEYLNQISEYRKSCQQALSKISVGLENEKLSGRRNIFKKEIMTTMQKNSATLIISPNSSLALDEVFISERLARAWGCEKDQGYLLIWRNPAISTGAIRMVKFSTKEDTVGLEINPAIVQSMDGDFDGDTIAAVYLDRPSLIKEGQRRLSCAANLLDISKDIGTIRNPDQPDETIENAHPFYLHTEMDIAVGVHENPKLSDAFDRLLWRANVSEQERCRQFSGIIRREAGRLVIQNEDQPKAQKILQDQYRRNLKITDDLNEWYQQCYSSAVLKGFVRFESMETALNSLYYYVKIGAKGKVSSISDLAAMVGQDALPLQASGTPCAPEEKPDHFALRPREQNGRILDSSELEACRIQDGCGTMDSLLYKSGATGKASKTQHYLLPVCRSLIAPDGRSMIAYALSFSQRDTQAMLSAKKDPKAASYKFSTLFEANNAILRDGVALVERDGKPFVPDPEKKPITAEQAIENLYSYVTEGKGEKISRQMIESLVNATNRYEKYYTGLFGSTDQQDGIDRLLYNEKFNRFKKCADAGLPLFTEEINRLYLPQKLRQEQAVGFCVKEVRGEYGKNFLALSQQEKQKTAPLLEQQIPASFLARQLDGLNSVGAQKGFISASAFDAQSAEFGSYTDPEAEEIPEVEDWGLEFF